MVAMPEASEVVARIEELAGAVSGGLPDIEVGSPLYDDDAATTPLHLSHAAWTAVTIATDHLIAYRALIVKAQQTQPWAHHTLLRAAIENAATAVWLVAPAQRSDRVERRLRLATTDIAESAAAQKLHHLRAPSGRTAVQRQNQVANLARRAGLGGTMKWRGYAPVIREAAGGAHMPPDTLELAWRLGSGLAHGRSWASIGLLKGVDHSAPGDPVRNLEMSASLEQLNMFAMTALSLTSVARRFFEHNRLAASD